MHKKVICDDKYHYWYPGDRRPRKTHDNCEWRTADGTHWFTDLSHPKDWIQSVRRWPLSFKELQAKKARENKKKPGLYEKLIKNLLKKEFHLSYYRNGEPFLVVSTNLNRTSKTDRQHLIRMKQNMLAGKKV